MRPRALLSTGLLYGVLGLTALVTLPSACGAHIGEPPSDDARARGEDGAGAAASGASGAGGAVGGGAPATAPLSFTCDPAAQPPELPLRRLSRLQYHSALADLVDALAPGASAPILAAAKDALAKVPDDARRGPAGETRGGYRRLDQDVSQAHVDATMAVAEVLAKELSSPARLGATVGACAVDASTANDASCITDFIARAGALAHRAPLDEGDVAFYESVYASKGIDPLAIADVLTVMLTGPRFLYLVEHGGAASPSGPSVFALSGWELASRLSFHFWQTMPDQVLRDAAKSGELTTDDGYAKQVARLAADPRARASFDVFAREWLWLDDLKEMDGLVGTPVYDAFAQGFAPGPDLREHMIDEIADMVFWHASTGKTFDDVLRSDRSFARTPDLAAIYGVAPWDGAGAPPGLPDGRVGLVTRAGLVATGSANTRPIMKGVFLRKGLLCDEVPPPPNNANAKAPELSPQMTTREVVTQLTEQPGSACAGCHATMINALGFATEGFDALGRARQKQTLFDAAGKVVGEKPVDTHGTPHVTPGDERVASGHAELTKLLVESGRPQACFVRNYLRYTFGRPEDLTRDGCALEDLRKAVVVDGKPLSDVLARVALTPAFRRRAFLSSTSWPVASEGRRLIHFRRRGSVANKNRGSRP